MKKASKFFFTRRISTAPRIALPLFILLAAFLHLSTVYLFNIVYQAPHLSKPLAAQIFFLLPGSSSSEQLAPWLQAHDPAIFSPLKTIQVHRPPPSLDLRLSSQPPPLHLLPEKIIAGVKPPALPVYETVLSTSLLFGEKKLSTPNPLIPALKRTTVSFLNELAPRALMLSASAPDLPSTINNPLPPTTLRANVDPAGIPRHVIIVESSGNNDADEAATHWMMTCRLAPAMHETWGNLVVLWGSPHREDDQESKSEK